MSPIVLRWYQIDNEHMEMTGEISSSLYSEVWSIRSKQARRYVHDCNINCSCRHIGNPHGSVPSAGESTGLASLLTGRLMCTVIDDVSSMTYELARMTYRDSRASCRCVHDEGNDEAVQTQDLGENEDENLTTGKNVRYPAIG